MIRKLSTAEHQPCLAPGHRELSLPALPAVSPAAKFSPDAAQPGREHQHRRGRCWQRNGFKTVGTLPGAFHHPRLGFVDALV